MLVSGSAPYPDRPEWPVYLSMGHRPVYNFLCPLCPEEATNGNGQFFLYKGEVYKYGQTISPSDRYSKTELARWNLEYIELLVSDLTTVTTEETIRK
ncbi:MAG: hypothetical protein J5I94_13450, partial [Phaeodactylibacter sp.]|nr:hypothetical protein [Phaeodactylibacter sp.]